MNLARPKRLRNLPHESGQQPSHRDDRPCERLLRLQHDRLLRTIEQRNIREDGLPVASRTRLSTDAPPQLPDFRAAEFSEPSNYAVQLKDRPKFALTKRQPPPNSRLGPRSIGR